MLRTVVKFAILFVILVAFLTALTNLIPTQLTDNINNAIIYMISQMNYLNDLIPMASIYNSMQVLAEFYFSIVMFIFLKWIAHFFKST